MQRQLLQGGTVVTDLGSFPADVLIEDEHIANVGRGIPANGAEVVSVGGKLILPGGVDPHTHFDLPMFDTVSSDDHYTGHKAAAFGGTTTVMDFVPQLESGSLEAGLDEWLEKAAPKAAIDFSFHMNVTHLDAAILSEIARLSARGVTSLKVFTAYNNRLRLHDGEIFRVLRAAGEHGLLTMLHAENGDVIEILVAEALAAGQRSPVWHARTRPAWGAVEATLRGICAGGSGRRAAVCRARQHRRRGRPDPLRPRPRPSSDGRNLPAVPVLHRGRSGTPGRRQVGVLAADAHAAADNAALWAGLCRRRSTDRRHRPLSILLRWHPSDRV